MTGARDDTALPGGDAALCAEYVLGLLPEDEVRALEARLSDDVDLQAEVAYWSEHFADLAETVPEVTPSPAVLRRIELSAFGTAPPSVWQHVRPYLFGALAAAGVAWLATISGVLDPEPTAPPAPADTEDAE